MSANGKVSRKETINIGKAVRTGEGVRLLMSGRSDEEIKKNLELSDTGLMALKHHYDGWR